MSEGQEGKRGKSDAEATGQAREGLKQAEKGEIAGARKVEKARAEDAPGAAAAEQEASDGPEGRGLSR